MKLEGKLSNTVATSIHSVVIYATVFIAYMASAHVILVGFITVVASLTLRAKDSALYSSNVW